MGGVKLGHVQQSVLECLKAHGAWYPCCGWIWDNYSGTKRILDSLVRKGLVCFDGKKYTLKEQTL